VTDRRCARACAAATRDPSISGWPMARRLLLATTWSRPGTSEWAPGAATVTLEESSPAGFVGSRRRQLPRACRRNRVAWADADHGGARDRRPGRYFALRKPELSQYAKEWTKFALSLSIRLRASTSSTAASGMCADDRAFVAGLVINCDKGDRARRAGRAASPRTKRIIGPLTRPGSSGRRHSTSTARTRVAQGS